MTKLYVVFRHAEDSYRDVPVVLGYMRDRIAAAEAAVAAGGWVEEAEEFRPQIAATFTSRAKVDAEGDVFDMEEDASTYIVGLDAPPQHERTSRWWAVESGPVWLIEHTAATRQEAVAQAMTETALMQKRPPQLGDAVRGEEGDFGDALGRYMPGHRMLYPDAWPEPTRGSFRFGSTA